MTLEQRVLKGGFNRIKNSVGNIVLRPNDHKKLFGEDKFKELVEAVETILERDYKNTELYTYYHFMKSCENKGFWMFDGWEWKEAYNKSLA